MEQVEFEGFFRSSYPSLVRYARRRFDVATAEELAASTLHTIWAKDLPAPNDDVDNRRLWSLSYRILQGLMQNAARAERAHGRAVARLAAAQVPTPAPDAWATVVEDSWPPWAEMISHTDREVLALVVDGYRVAEIAVILDTSPAAVTMRLQRARKNLRLLWAREAGRG